MTRVQACECPIRTLNSDILNSELSLHPHGGGPNETDPSSRSRSFSPLLAGCHHGDRQRRLRPGRAWRPPRQIRGLPQVDRPFPIGQVTDSFWETQQTNAEAADFIFYDHEFRGNTAELAPGAKKHLEQVALRLEHVPFPVVIEESPHRRPARARPGPAADDRRAARPPRRGQCRGARRRRQRLPRRLHRHEAEGAYYNGSSTRTRLRRRRRPPLRRLRRRLSVGKPDDQAVPVVSEPQTDAHDPQRDWQSNHASSPTPDHWSGL